MRLDRFKNQFVAGFDCVDEAYINGACAIPGFSCGDYLKIKFRALSAYKVLK